MKLKTDVYCYPATLFTSRYIFKTSGICVTSPVFDVVNVLCGYTTIPERSRMCIQYTLHCRVVSLRTHRRFPVRFGTLCHSRVQHIYNFIITLYIVRVRRVKMYTAAARRAIQYRARGLRAGEKNACVWFFVLLEFHRLSCVISPSRYLVYLYSYMKVGTYLVYAQVRVRAVCSCATILCTGRMPAVSVYVYIRICV